MLIIIVQILLKTLIKRLFHQILVDHQLQTIDTIEKLRNGLYIITEAREKLLKSAGAGMLIALSTLILNLSQFHQCISCGGRHTLEEQKPTIWE